MSRQPAPADPPATSSRAGWFLAFAVMGLIFASSSAFVHYRLLHDPTYTSFCDVNGTFSCTEAYSSRFGAVAGVPVAIVGALFFAFIAGLVVLCRRSEAATANLPGYVFALSTLALAAVLYLGYASFVILKAVCLLCVGTYVAVIGLFIVSGATTRYPMTTLPGRLSRDLGALMRTPAALSAALAFAVAAVAVIVMFPGQPVSAAPADGDQVAAPAVPAATAQQIKDFEAYLAAQPRVAVMVPSDGAAVVLIKFNDYQCPPCRETFMQYKPVLAKWAKEAPGKLKFMTKDYPLDRECNPKGGDAHAAACEAAVAVRLARQKGKAEALEEWLFANQPTMTPDKVRQGAKEVGGVTDMEARYAATLELVKSDIAQGGSLGVTGTPTFFLNGIKLPGLRPEFIDAAIAWEMKRVASGGR